MLSKSFGEKRIKIADPVKVRRYDQIEKVLDELICRSEFRKMFRDAQEDESCIDNLLYHLRRITRNFPDEIAQAYKDVERKLRKEELSTKAIATRMNKQFSFPWMKTLIDSGLSENESSLEIAKCFCPNVCPDDTPFIDRIGRIPYQGLKRKADSILKAYRRSIGL